MHNIKGQAYVKECRQLASCKLHFDAINVALDANSGAGHVALCALPGASKTNLVNPLKS